MRREMQAWMYDWGKYGAGEGEYPRRLPTNNVGLRCSGLLGGTVFTFRRAHTLCPILKV